MPLLGNLTGRATVVSLADLPEDAHEGGPGFVEGPETEGAEAAEDGDKEEEEEIDYQELIEMAPGDNEEEEPAAGPAKRKPGRPRKSAADKAANGHTTPRGRKRKTAPVAADAPPSKQGRPARSARAAATKAIAENAPKKRGVRGRPKKDVTAAAKPPAKRGRKPAAKSTNAEDDDEEWEVEAILQDVVDENYEHVYLVKWQGFSNADNTWEPKKNLEGCPELLKAYEDAKAKGAPKKTRGRKRKAKDA